MPRKPFDSIQFMPQTHRSWGQSYPEFSQHSRKQAIQIRAFLPQLCPENHLIQFNSCPKPIGLGDNPTQNLASIRAV
jgi:hypothetical protein